MYITQISPRDSRAMNQVEALLARTAEPDRLPRTIPAASLTRMKTSSPLAAPSA